MRLLKTTEKTKLKDQVDEIPFGEEFQIDAAGGIRVSCLRTDPAKSRGSTFTVTGVVDPPFGPEDLEL